GLVGGGGDDVGVRHGGWVRPPRHQPDEVGRVDHEHRTDLVGDGTEGGEVEVTGVCGVAGQEDLGPVLQGEPAHLLHVDHLGLGVDAVGDELVVQAGEVHGRAVGEVPAVVETHAQHLVTRLEQGEVDGHV